MNEREKKIQQQKNEQFAKNFKKMTVGIISFNHIKKTANGNQYGIGDYNIYTLYFSIIENEFIESENYNLNISELGVDEDGDSDGEGGMIDLTTYYIDDLEKLANDIFIKKVDNHFVTVFIQRIYDHLLSLDKVKVKRLTMGLLGCKKIAKKHFDSLDYSNDTHLVFKRVTAFSRLFEITVKACFPKAHIDNDSANIYWL